MSSEDSKANVVQEAQTYLSKHDRHSVKPSSTHGLAVVDVLAFSTSHFVYREYVKITPGVNLLRLSMNQLFWSP